MSPKKQGHKQTKCKTCIYWTTRHQLLGIMRIEIPSFHPQRKWLWHFHPKSKGLHSHSWSNESWKCQLVLTNRLMMDLWYYCCQTPEYHTQSGTRSTILKLISDIRPKVTLCFTPYPLFQWYPQSNETLLDLGTKCWNSAFNT